MKVHHIALTVRNIENSLKFYRDYFGFVEVRKFERREWNGKAVFIKLGDVYLELWQFDKQIKNKDNFSNLNILGIKHIAFEVDDIQKKYRKLKSENIEISKLVTGTTGKYCFLKDPDGIFLELYEKR